jgi:hypothetical protein
MIQADDISASPIGRALRCRLSSIQKLGNGRDKLRWREGLVKRMLLGAPWDGHSAALPPVI